VSGEPTTFMLEEGAALVNIPAGMINIALSSQYLIQASDALLGIENYVSYIMIDCFTGSCNLYGENAQLAANLKNGEFIRVDKDQISALTSEKGHTRYAHWIRKFGQAGATEFSAYQTPTAIIKTLTATPELTLTPEATLTLSGTPAENLATDETP
jgi:hypothetical protein